ncbi:HDIG domain-containing protein [Phormidesmis priestleyi ULC007]|uniref:HDIG domain-containing protein n=1 Tax=Phormidesmis priestleyi ULC007 TaxID=1920490 RepID=A0A2T1DI03_9CYAN|nr:HDIG domain-containing metalloprotein [Phormidesmis priestleyi]PSB20107.1 HDIG domain-containing protein [Phormidesmis priestleyi ULC007]PZO48971.1 MAG: HDIG domain-containing protein [Phormidesmis priestleyi]
MRSFQSLTRRIQQICISSGKSLQQKALNSGLPRLILSSIPASANLSQGSKRLRKRLSFREGVHPTIVIAITVISITSAFGQRFYNQPQLSVGKVSSQTIHAPADANVIDTKATEEKRKAARTIAVTVLMADSRINDQIHQDLQAAFGRGNTFRQLAGAYPFVDSKTLSAQTQRYLRKVEEGEWRGVLAALQEKAPIKQVPGKPAVPNFPKTPIANPAQGQAIAELQNYRRSGTPQNLAALLDKVTEARRLYAAAIATLKEPTTAQFGDLYDAAFLDLSDFDWEQLQLQITQVNDRILAQGISPGLPQSLLENAVNLQTQVGIAPELRAIAARLLLTTLQPNLIKDEEQSKLKAEQAAQEVQPEVISVRQGEVIVGAGQTITQREFVLLDSFNLSLRGTNWLGFITFGVVVSGAVVLFWFVDQRFHVKGLRNRDYVLVWLLTLTTPLLVTLGVPSTNLPAIGLLMGTFYGSTMALTLTGLLSGLLPMGMTIGVSHWLPSVAGGLLAAFFGGRLRSREELALLGVAVGLTQGVLFLILSVASGMVWYGLLGATAIYALLGLAWSIVAIGLSPYLENLFDLVTTIRLVELANPNRPLLKRLAAETPGTFQHTLFVATLAEAAARELGCNVELVRTGTLYHDIGKMHDPQGFIENQMGGPNKHDLINDPWKSAAIIRKHVTEGIVMARKARLPKVVQAFIPEHQGSMLISYFHHQAQQILQQDPTKSVNDDDFRYAGPAPQSRETGIVMVADSCEAALRSLKDATPEDALNMINKILRARWQDGQLAETGLTREEMDTIAQIFVQVWQQSNHQRIAYPKLTAK